MATFKKLIIDIFLPLVVLIILVNILFGPSALYEDVKNVILGIARKGPDMKIGLEELKAEQPMLGQKQQSQASALRATLERLVQSQNTDCFGHFGGFDELGEGEKSASITITTVSGGMEVVVVNPLGQEVERYTIAAQPCVIAGAAEVTQNFFRYFIEQSAELREPYTRTVRGVQIKYGEDYLNGNTLRVADPTFAAVNGESDNFESAYVFKGKNNEICFFPTNKVVDSDADGIDNDWFDSAKAGSIPHRLKNNDARVKAC